MKKAIPVLFLLVFIGIKPAESQVDTLDNQFAVTDTQDVKVTLFDTDDLFEISLKFDLNEFRRVRSDQDYLDAVLTYFSSDKDSVSKNIKVKARGNIRRTGDICDFPPLMLNFKMKSGAGDDFSGINKLKLVPYCRVGYEEYILKEYLVYKLYNIVTDYSFKVRLFKVNYINSVKEKKPITQFGFVIEPLEFLQKRADLIEITYPNITQRAISPESLDKMAIFNYMIGNTDWSVPVRHNIIILTKKQSGANENISLAYDFDYSGLVNAPYAIPFETLPIKVVRERLYLAVCRSESEFTKTLNEFLEKKEQFYKVVNDFPYLSAKVKKDLTGYLDQFFDGIGKKNYTVKNILKDCSWYEEQSNLRTR